MLYQRFKFAQMKNLSKILASEGVPPLKLLKCKGKPLINYKIYGSYVAGTTQTPSNPVEVKFLGDLVANGEYQGKYKIPISIGGKNIWDKVSSYTGGESQIIESPKLFTGVTYTISFDVSADYSYSTSSYLFSLRRDGSGRSNIYNSSLIAGQRYSYTFTNIDLVWFNNQDNYSGTISNIQIEEGSTATSYESYRMPIITNIYLDEPLRKIGTGSFADYIDFDNGKIVRKVGVKIFNGSENFNVSEKTSVLQVITDSFPSMQATGDTWDACTSNWLVWSGTTYNNPDNNPNKIVFQTRYHRAFYNVLKSDFSDRTAWINYVTQQYNNGTPFMVYYPIPEGSETLIETLPQISTLTGNCVVRIDAEINASNLWVKYKGKN